MLLVVAEPLYVWFALESTWMNDMKEECLKMCGKFAGEARMPRNRTFRQLESGEVATP